MFEWWYFQLTMGLLGHNKGRCLKTQHRELKGHLYINTTNILKIMFILPQDGRRFFLNKKSYFIVSKRVIDGHRNKSLKNREEFTKNKSIFLPATLNSTHQRQIFTLLLALVLLEFIFVISRIAPRKQRLLRFEVSSKGYLYKYITICLYLYTSTSFINCSTRKMRN